MKKISFACDDNGGLQAQLSGHFGRCPYYTLVDVEGTEIKGVHVIENPYFNNHVPGQVPQFIKDQNANVMIAGGMGPRAIDLFSSFGIEVAKLAALPATVINRAQEILQLVLSPSSHFEKMADRESQIEYSKITTSEVSNNNIENQQLKHHIQKLESIVQTQARVANHLKSIEVDNLSARQALDLVWSLKDMLKESM